LRREALGLFGEDSYGLWSCIYRCMQGQGYWWEAASIYKKKKMQVVEKITHKILVAMQGKFNNTMK
jgi:hypothetical protein